MPDITTGNDGSVKISVDFDISEAESSSKDLKKILEKFSSQVEKSFDKLATTLNKVQGTLEETAKTQKQMAQSAEESAKSNSENTNTLKAMLSVLRSVNASMSDFSKTQRQVSDGAKSNVSSMTKNYENLINTVKELQVENQKLKQSLSSKTETATPQIDLTKNVDRNVSSINRQNQELKETETILTRVEDTKAFQKLQSEIEATFKKAKQSRNEMLLLQKEVESFEVEPNIGVLRESLENIFNILPKSTEKGIAETLSKAISTGGEKGVSIVQKSLTKLFEGLTAKSTTAVDELDKRYEKILSERRSFLAGILSDADLKKVDEFDRKLDKLDASFRRIEENSSLENSGKALEKLNNAIEKTVNQKFDLLGKSLSEKDLKIYDDFQNELQKIEKQYNSQIEKSEKLNESLSKINKISFDNVKQKLFSLADILDDFVGHLKEINAYSNLDFLEESLDDATKSFQKQDKQLKDLIAQRNKMKREFQPQETSSTSSQKEVVNEQKRVYAQQEQINESAQNYSSAVLRATENLKKQQIVVENIKQELASYVEKATPSDFSKISSDISYWKNYEKEINKEISRKEDEIRTSSDGNLRRSRYNEIKDLKNYVEYAKAQYKDLETQKRQLANIPIEDKIKLLSSEPYYQQLVQKLELATLREQRYQAVLEETIAKQEKKNSSNEKASKSTEKMGKSATKTAHYLDNLSHYMGESAEKTDSFAKRMYDAVRATTRAVTPINSVNNSLLNLGKRILNTAKSALLFSVLYRAFNQLSSVVSAVAMQNQTFANSLAQIKANLWTAFAPIWNAALPALNALMSALAEITGYLAAFIAMLFGKSVKVTQKQGEALQQQASAADVAADSLDDVAGSAGDVADGMSDAAEATAEANKELAAYDKLNVINIEKPDTGAGDSGGGGGGSGGGGGGTGDIGNIVEAEPVIEELNDLDPKVFEKIKKRLEDILDIVISIGAAFAAWKIANILNNLFDLDLKLRQLVGITMMVGGFTLSFTGWENVGKGEADLIDALKIIIGSALGIAGSLLTFGTGPLGWTIGIGASILVAIIGISVGQAEKLKQQISDIFYKYTEGAISVTVLADAYESLVSTVISANQPIIEAGDTIESLRDSNFIAGQSFESIVAGINMGLYSAEEKLPELQSLFQEMSSNVKLILDDTYLIIVTALGGALGDVIEKSGQDKDEYVKLVAETMGIAEEAYDNFIQQKQELDAALSEGSITEEEYANRLYEITKELKGLGDTDLSGYEEKIASLKRTVNWTDEEERNNALSKIAEISKEAKESVEQSSDDIVDALTTLKNFASEEDKIKFENLIDLTPEYGETQLAPIKDQILQIINTIQADVLTGVADVAQNAYTEWENSNPLFRATTPSAAVMAQVQSYVKDYISPISSSLDESLSQLGLDGNIWMEDSLYEILQPLLQPGFMSEEETKNFISGIYDSIDEEIKSNTPTSSETAEQSGQEIGDSLSDGIQSSNPETSISTAFDGIDSFIKSGGTETKTTAETSGKEIGSGLTNALLNSFLEGQEVTNPEIKQALLNGMTDIKEGTQPTAQSTGSAISSSLVTSLLSTDMATVFGQGSPIYTTGISNLGVLKNGLTSTAKTVGADTMTSLSDGVDNNSSLPENSLTLVGEAMKNSFFSVLGISSGSSSEMYNAATYTIAGLTSGIDVSAANPNNSIKKVGDTLVSTTKSIFGIKGGKSSVYDAFGTSLGSDLSLGISNSGKKARNSMITTLNGINTTTNRMAGTISGSFRSMFNNILSYASTFANRLVNSVTSALSKVNVATSSARVGSSGRLTYSIPSSVYVPKLAKGAVLPANQPFLAMVGDQKRGTNVEAPLETIKQGLREVLGELNTNSNSNVNVYLQGDAREIFRVVKVENDKYKKQTGGKGL